MNRTAVPSPDAAPAIPACPVCRSDKVSTTAKAISDATYWRCHKCGEIWNQSRLRAVTRWHR
jgi:transposase-like protein